MHEQDTFQVILHSGSSLEYFPKNTSSCFSNVLPTISNFNKYDVALASLYYYDDFVSSEEDLTVPEVEPTGEPFFKPGTDENKIRFFDYTFQEINVPKKNVEFPNFITSANQLFEQMNAGIRLGVTYDDKQTPTRAAINYTGSNGFELYTSSEFAKILGFSKLTFDAGAHVSDTPPDEQYFLGLALETTLVVEQRKYVIKTAEVEQLTNPSLDDLNLAIMVALTKVQANVSFQAEDDLLVIDTFSRRNYLVLSKRLNDYLGISKPVIGRMEFTVPKSIVDPPPATKNYLSPSATKKAFSSNKLLVVCNVASNNVFDNKLLPVIAVINRKGGQEEKENIQTPLLFYPVSLRDSNTIKISLLDETLKPIKAQNHPTVCTLHFKRRRL